MKASSDEHERGSFFLSFFSFAVWSSRKTRSCQLNRNVFELRGTQPGKPWGYPEYIYVLRKKKPQVTADLTDGSFLEAVIEIIRRVRTVRTVLNSINDKKTANKLTIKLGT